MRKIFSILVVLMMVAGTFVSCNMPTNTNTDTGSSTGIDTTVPPVSNDSEALKKFIKETFTDFNQSRDGKVYSGKIKGTENDYVLIPAKAAVPNDFRKVDDKSYSFGDAGLYKDSTGGINIYFYYDGDDYFCLDRSPYTITMSSTMNQKYFDYDSVNDMIVIGEETFNVVY